MRRTSSPLVELETRYDYADAAYANGIDETMRIDQTPALASSARRRSPPT